MSEVKGYGTVLEYGTASFTGTGSTVTDSYSGSGITGTFTGGTAVGKIRDLTPLDRKVSELDATTFDSLNQTEEYVAGFLKPGSVKFTAKYNRTGFFALEGLVGVEKGWRLTLANGDATVFKGFLSGDALKVERDGINMMEFEIKVTGVSAVAQGS